VDRKLQQIAAKCGGSFEAGPSKSNARLLEKATLSYKDNVRRVTDIERRSMIFGSFGKMAKAVQQTAADFTVARIKNRFKSDGAKQTAGYRDCQVLVLIPGSELLLELQFHISDIHDLKSKVATTMDKEGESGHDRYIRFRALMEQAQALN